MKTEIISGLIGAGATIIAALLSSPLITKSIIAKNKSKIYIQNSSLKEAISGQWYGKNIQEVGVSGSGMEVLINCQFETLKKGFIGTMMITWQENGSAHQLNLNCEGGFLSENHIRLTYVNDSQNIQNFGVSFLRLNSSGDELKGAMIGYGHRFEQIIKGEITLIKTK